MVDYHELIYALDASEWLTEQPLVGYVGDVLCCPTCNTNLVFSLSLGHTSRLFLRCGCVEVSEVVGKGDFGGQYEKNLALKYIAELEKEVTHAHE